MHFVKSIPKNFRAAHAIVHLDTHRSHPNAAGFVNVIVANTISAKRIIAPGINRADVARLQRDMVNFVKLDQMIVAAEKHCRVRMIVNQIMRSALADAAQQNRRDVALGPSALPLEVAVFDKMSARRKCLTIAATQRNAAIAGVENIATPHAVSMAAFDYDASVANIPNQTAGDEIARAATNFHSVRARRFKNQSPHNDVRSLGDVQQRPIQQRKQCFGFGSLVALRLFWRPEVKHPLRPIEKPFAGLIEFLQHVQKIKSLTLPKTVKSIRRSRAYEMARSIEFSHPFGRIRP